MFNNIGLHTELLSPLIICFLLIGGILGYGSKFILKLVYENPSEKAVLIVKLVGLVLVLAGIILVFKR